MLPKTSSIRPWSNSSSRATKNPARLGYLAGRSFRQPGVKNGCLAAEWRRAGAITTRPAILADLGRRATQRFSSRLRTISRSSGNSSSKCVSSSAHTSRAVGGIMSQAARILLSRSRRLSPSASMQPDNRCNWSQKSLVMGITQFRTAWQSKQSKDPARIVVAPRFGGWVR